MSDFGYSTGATRLKTYGGVAGTSLGTTITAPGAANTKGNWAPIVASTDFPAVGIIVSIQVEPGSGDSYCLIDVGVGAGGVEIVLIPNLLATRYGTSDGGRWSVYVPVAIPAGTNVSMRYQASGTAPVIYGTITIVGGQAKRQLLSPGLCTDYGSVTGTSKGTAVDPGATANTESGWQPLTASTTYACRGLILCVAANTCGSGTNPRWLVDVAVGAGGAEQAVVTDIIHSNGGQSAGIHFSDGGWHYLPMAIPAGTRVSVQAQCSINTASDRALNVNVIGVS